MDGRGIRSSGCLRCYIRWNQSNQRKDAREQRNARHCAGHSGWRICSGGDAGSAGTCERAGLRGAAKGVSLCAWIGWAGRSLVAASVARRLVSVGA